MLSLRHSIGNASPLESLARNSKSVPHFRCYASPPRTETYARCHDALVVWQEEQTLLDGHHRHAICEQHSLDYRIQELSLPDLEAAKAWTIANQLGRRNLTPE